MAIRNFLSQTLIRNTAPAVANLFSSAMHRTVRRFYAQPESSSYTPEVEVESKEKAVESLEDIIHDVIVMRSRPDWLPLVPGASYWAPPRRSSYGVSDAFDKMSNALTNEEYLSLVTVQGWPSSAYFLPDGVFSLMATLDDGAEYCNIENYIPKY